jgi:serine/threonine-protein kinase
MARTPRLRTGTVFRGDLEILEPIGRGAMGAVYLVRHLPTGAKRALKVLPPEVLEAPKGRERFAREVRVGASIESRHVVAVLDAGIDDATGLGWVLMEHVAGEPLARVFARGPIAPQAARQILAQLFDAMAAAHRAGVVHRDLKPENILVGGADWEHDEALEVKVVDFGIAKTLSADSGVTTASGLGTPMWVAPEQSSARATVTPAADVWALGLITFSVLTGKIYWWHYDRGTAADFVQELVRGELPAASKRAHALGSDAAIGARLDAWFARCIVRDPTKRFRDAGQAWRALAPLLGARRVPVRPWILAAAALGGALLGVAWWLWAR